MSKEIKRLQQLAGLNEIKVNKPINKKEIFDYFLNNGRLIFITNFIDSDLQTVIDDSGENSLEEYAEYHEVDPNMIKAFYNSNLNNEITYYAVSEHEDVEKLEGINNCKTVLAQGGGDGMVYIIGHNL